MSGMNDQDRIEAFLAGIVAALTIVMAIFIALHS